MLFNRNNLNVAKIASKSEMRPELSAVFFKSDRTVATDTFRLLEVTTPSDAKPEDFPDAMRGVLPFLVPANKVKEVKMMKTGFSLFENVAVKHADDIKIELLTTDGTNARVYQMPRVNGKFPDYEQVFPTGQPQAEITINGKYLANLLEIMSELNQLHSITIKIYGNEKPVALFAESQTQKARGLLMPLNP